MRVRSSGRRSGGAVQYPQPGIAEIDVRRVRTPDEVSRNVRDAEPRGGDRQFIDGASTVLPGTEREQTERVTADPPTAIAEECGAGHRVGEVRGGPALPLGAEHHVGGGHPGDAHLVDRESAELDDGPRLGDAGFDPIAVEFAVLDEASPHRSRRARSRP